MSKPLADGAPAPRPTRVLYVLNYPTPGGPTTSLLKLLEQMGGRVEATVYSPGRAAAEPFRHAGIRTVIGPVSHLTHAVFFRYSGRDWAFFARELLLLPPHILYLSYLLIRYRFDIVHLNEAGLVAAAVVARLFRTPVVWHLRSVLPRPDGTRRLSLLQWGYRRCADVVLAIEAAVYEHVAQLPHAHILNNPVDIDRFSCASPGTLRRRLGVKVDEVCVGIIGRADPDEGLHDVIDAAGILQQSSDRHVKFVWIGATGGSVSPRRARLLTLAKRLGLRTGQYADEAKRTIEARGVHSLVRFAPYEREIWSAYQELDIILTGGAAGLGRQALEGCAAGRPVIALTSLGWSDIVEDGVNGYLVPNGRPELLAARIRSLAASPMTRARMGRRGREVALENACPRRLAERLLGFYDSVLHGAPLPVPALPRPERT